MRIRTVAAALLAAAALTVGATAAASAADSAPPEPTVGGPDIRVEFCENGVVLDLSDAELQELLDKGEIQASPSGPARVVEAEKGLFLERDGDIQMAAPGTEPTGPTAPGESAPKLPDGAANCAMPSESTTN